MTPREEVLGIIRERKGDQNMLAVPRAFIELTGDTDSALLLSQLLYWTERAASPQGWVYKSRDDWRLELGLNRYRLDRARRRLRDLGVLEEAHHLVGSRRILHLKPRCSDLCAALNAQPRDAVAGFKPRHRPAPSGTGVSGPSERSGVDRPDRGFPAVRAFEDEPSEQSNFDRSRTETTAETTPETPAETTASSSSTRAKGEESLRSRDNRENRTGAPDGSGGRSAASGGRRGSLLLQEDIATAPGRHGSLPLQEDIASAPGRRGSLPPQEGTASAPGRHGSLPLQEDTATAPGSHGSLPLQEDAAPAPGRRGSLLPQEGTASAQAEDRLFAILERVSGFPRDRDRAQLRGQLADYPEVDHLLEIKKFAAFYENRTLDRPWFALLNWLDKASMRSAHGPAPAPSAGKPPPAGASHPVPSARKPAEPLPLGLTTAGPAYWKMVQRRQSENPAPP